MKVVILDFDYTLAYTFDWDVDRSYSLYDETIDVLDILVDKNIKMVVATNNVNCITYLKTLNIETYFDHIEAYEDETHKESHILKILEKYNTIDKDDFILYDDDNDNISTAKSLGIKYKRVDYTVGITVKDILDTLK